MADTLSWKPNNAKFRYFGIKANDRQLKSMLLWTIKKTCLIKIIHILIIHLVEESKVGKVLSSKIQILKKNTVSRALNNWFVRINRQDKRMYNWCWKVYTKWKKPPLDIEVGLSVKDRIIRILIWRKDVEDNYLERKNHKCRLRLN